VVDQELEPERSGIQEQARVAAHRRPAPPAAMAFGLVHELVLSSTRATGGSSLIRGPRTGQTGRPEQVRRDRAGQRRPQLRP
jgi:hypothetical protein